MGSGVSQRLEAIVESATLAITARAKELSARGEKVVDFGVGEPDFPTPAHIVEAAAAAAREYRYQRYTPTAGLPELRRAVAAKTRRDSGYAVEPGQVLITNGAKGAVYTACQALLDPGDEVLLPAPYWVTYPEAVALAGGVTRPIPTTVAAGFRVTVEQLEAARTPRTKMLIFVSPSNPTGAVYPPDEVAAIGRWAAQHGIWVLTDEIYEHLVYGSARFCLAAGGGPGGGGALRGGQRAVQDLRHDRVAGGVDDRPGRSDPGGDPLPVAHRLQRGQRQPGGDAARPWKGR